MFKKFIPLYILISTYSFFAMKSVGLPYTNTLFALKYAPYLALAALGSFFYWFLFLKKSVPLKVISEKPGSYGFFLVILGFCLASIIATFLSAESIKFEYFPMLLLVAVVLFECILFTVLSDLSIY